MCAAKRRGLWKIRPCTVYVKIGQLCGPPEITVGGKWPAEVAVTVYINTLGKQ